MSEDHTPLPWRPSADGLEVLDAEGETILTSTAKIKGSCLAAVARTVRACNAHDAMVAACERMAFVLGECNMGCATRPDAEAQARAEVMRQERLASLRKQIARLEAMRFDGPAKGASNA
jgi:hypothetical protein